MDQEQQARRLVSGLTEGAFKSLEFDAHQHLLPRSLRDRNAKLAVGQTCWVILGLTKPYQAEVVEAEEGRDEHYRVRDVGVPSKGRGELAWSDHLFLTEIEAVVEWQERLAEEMTYWQGILERACECVRQRREGPLNVDLLPQGRHELVRGVAPRTGRGYRGSRTGRP